MKNILFSICILTTAFLSAVELKVNFSKDTSVTTLTLTGAEEGRLYNIYRGGKALSRGELDWTPALARRLDGKSAPVVYTPTASVDVWYTLASTDMTGAGLKVENAVGPVTEIDRVPPTTPDVKFCYEEAIPVLRWRLANPDNPENISAVQVFCRRPGDKEAVLAASIEPGVDGDGEYRDESREWLKHGEAVYFIRAVDGAGNAGKASRNINANRAAKIVLDGSPLVSMNPALSVTKMYPKVGEKVEFTVCPVNVGALASAPFRISVIDADGKECASGSIGALEADAGGEFKWSWTPQRPGRFEFTIVVDVDGVAGGPCRFRMEAAAVKKDVYFIWYGDVRNLPYSNTGQCMDEFIGEWKRRGGLAMRGVGVGPNGQKNYLAALGGGYDGINIDEVFMFENHAPLMAEQLVEVRRKHPDKMIALWTIGDKAAPEIVKLVRDGIVDLLMFEVYVKPGEDTAPLRRAVDNIRSYGILEKSLMGLVTDKSWSNWVTPEEQAKSIISQMRLVHELAPEMPGFAFWSSDTQPGVSEAVDAECYRLFIETVNSDPN